MPSKALIGVFTAVSEMDVVQRGCIAAIHLLQEVKEHSGRKRRWRIHLVANRLSTGQFHETARKTLRTDSPALLSRPGALKVPNVRTMPTY